MRSSEEDFKYRKIMWLFISDIFAEDDDDEVVFIWLFNDEDKREANQFPDGMMNCSGYYKGIIDEL